jgi:hypothetical protein
LDFLLGLGTAGSNISTPSPNRCHDAQFLSNLLEGDVFGQPLESIHHGLLVSHKPKLRSSATGRKTLGGTAK